ncbi:MAG: hypothetical protein IH900_06155 [Proteobacteria bacterium]|nr:hypothetical protein [Pseudomonadota bacterium]
MIPLESLVEEGAQVTAVVFPRPRVDDKGPRWMPAAAQIPNDLQLVVRAARENILTLAGAQGIPVLEVGSMRDAATLAAIEELQPDLVIVACFPQILPETMLKIPNIGCLNIHPSLLPAYRGPQPLFWQLRAGELNMGVTVHWMDVGVDTGDILGQVELRLAEGTRANEVDRVAAQAGADLIMKALKEDDWPRRPQGNEAASYQTAPRDIDRVIPTSWDVRRAFNFLRGAETWAPFWIEAEDGKRIEVREAIGYRAAARLEHRVEARDGESWVQMKDGVLRVKA